MSGRGPEYYHHIPFSLQGDGPGAQNAAVGGGRGYNGQGGGGAGYGGRGMRYQSTGMPPLQAGGRGGGRGAQ